MSLSLHTKRSPGLSAAPAHQKNQQSLSSQSGLMPPEAARDVPSPSNQSLASANNGQQPSAMKVKIYFGDDLIAIRVPTEIQYQALYDKIRDRLKIPAGEEIFLSYKDEGSGNRPNLISDNDLDIALSRNDKLIIYVESS